MPKNTPIHTRAMANTGQLATYTSRQEAVNCRRRPRQRVEPRRKRMALPQMNGASRAPASRKSETAVSCPVLTAML